MSRAMPESDWTDPACPIARTIDLVGDRWSLLILRDAFDGKRRFGEFQRSLGIAKNILSARLRGLTAAGILRAEPASDGSRFGEYVLTDRGRDLFDLILGLGQWGRDHAFSPGERHAELVDIDSDEPLPRLAVMTPEGRRVAPDRVRVRRPDQC
ncbi:helix-turn-helix domain-containing protein [Nocardia sp. NPDC004860]|uniref:winged helix-turn-helix transcriptional regulator n=1 Tax=Nocardia sp. NPDC004860 TaxID=3154557 RepID=UPI0033A9FE67